MLNPSLSRFHKGIGLVDRDPRRRAAVRRALTDSHILVRAYSSINSCLKNATSWGGCLILDFDLNRCGDLPKTLVNHGIDTPILYLDTGARTSDVTAAVKAGAFDFLDWPNDRESLANRIVLALEADLQRQRIRRRLESILARVRRLTRRQREVMHLVAQGHPNKIVCCKLGISERTVEVHRAEAMRRTGAESLAQMVILDLAANCFEERASWSLDQWTHGLSALVDMIAPAENSPSQGVIGQDDTVDGRRVA